MANLEPIAVSVMGGKLKGFQSLNVNTLDNPFCENMRRTSDVCAKCYSVRALSSYRSNAAPRWSRNADALRHPHPMPQHWIPFINASSFRLFSHGDVEDTNMARNVLQIVRAYPNTFFVGWSKNVSAWKEAMQADGKPENLRLIFSNGSLTTVRREPPQGFDMVFNVTSDKKHAGINCSGKCGDCMTCYDPKTPQGTTIIEKVK